MKELEEYREHKMDYKELQGKIMKEIEDLREQKRKEMGRIMEK